MRHGLKYGQSPAEESTREQRRGQSVVADARGSTFQAVRMTALVDASRRQDGMRAIARLTTGDREPVQRALIKVNDEGLDDDNRQQRCADAVANAILIVGDALRCLDEIERNDDELRVFETFFGADDLAAGLVTVRSTYEAARNILDTVRIVDHVDGMAVQGNEGMHAWSVLGGSIHLLETFWQSTPDQMALTLLHEATHVALDTEDGSGHGPDKAYERARSNPQTARNCAYNYEYFAQFADVLLAEGDEEEEAEADEAEQEVIEDAEREDGSEEKEEQGGSAIDLQRVAREEERMFAERLNELTDKYNASNNPKQRKRLRDEWTHIERILYNRGSMNGRVHTLWLSLTRIGQRVEID